MTYLIIIHSLEQSNIRNRVELRNTTSFNDSQYSRRITLPRNEPLANQNSNIKSPFKEETKNSNIEQDEMMRMANEITQSYIKRVSEHPKARLRKIWSKDEE